MNESHASANASPAVGEAPPAAVPQWDTAGQPPALPATIRRAGWTPGRIAALAIGAVVALVGLGLLGTGGTLLWADWTHRDGGYLTSGSHQFSTDGSALITVPADLGSGGTGWLYSPALLDTVRIRVQPTNPGSAMFVGIAPSADVDRYLARVSHTVITEYFRDAARAVPGGPAPAPPTSQSFWVASATGSGPQTVVWKPTAGSWTVVVMNADGQAGIDVATELGATAPALPWVGFGVLVAGAVFLAAGGLLVAGALRRRAG